MKESHRNRAASFDMRGFRRSDRRQHVLRSRRRSRPRHHIRAACTYVRELSGLREVARNCRVADIEIGHRTTTACHLGNIALRMKQKLFWDGRQERFTGNADADRMLVRPYRAPEVEDCKHENSSPKPPNPSPGERQPGAAIPESRGPRHGGLYSRIPQAPTEPHPYRRHRHRRALPVSAQRTEQGRRQPKSLPAAMSTNRTPRQRRAMKVAPGSARGVHATIASCWNSPTWTRW